MKAIVNPMTNHPQDMPRLPWTRLQEAVLCFILDSSTRRILLIHKLRGLGKGKVNGPGGKLEARETWLEAAARETREETGLIPHAPEHCADLDFTFTDGLRLVVKVYVARSWSGSLVDTEEALPFWQDQDSIPWDNMWEDDRLWLPRVLQGEKITGIFNFEGDRMLAAQISSMPS